MRSCRGRNLYRKYGKRILDITVSLLAIIVLLPVFFLAICIISFDSKGGPFFIQKRYGLKMKPFKLLKFRSMEAVCHDNQQQFEPGESKRVTKVGKLLRKTKIDELPELFNVVLGQMSLVGPRPEVEKYVRKYQNQYVKVLQIRPGLTDYASIKYRDEEKILSEQKFPEEYYENEILPDKLRLAEIYADNIAIREDLKIIFQTLKCLL